MRAVFADAAYWIAVTNPWDSWHEAAVAASNELEPGVRMVTTDEVLTEFLTALRRDRRLRDSAARVVRSILHDEQIHVVQQTRNSFLAGLARYEARADKRYSLQDCISMTLMEAEGIRDVLTSDRDFAREGFQILMAE